MHSVAGAACSMTGWHRTWLRLGVVEESCVHALLVDGRKGACNATKQGCQVALSSRSICMQAAAEAGAAADGGKHSQEISEVVELVRKCGGAEFRGHVQPQQAVSDKNGGRSCGGVGMHGHMKIKN